MFAFWKKKKQRKNGTTTFLCPEETEKAQRDIDKARKKSEEAQAQVTKMETLFGIEVGKLNGNNVVNTGELDL